MLLHYMFMHLHSSYHYYDYRKPSINTANGSCMFRVLFEFVLIEVNTLTGRWYNWHHLKVTHWWADDAKCTIHWKFRQNLSNSPIVFVLCYIYAQKVLGSNMYAQVTCCPSMSAAPGNWQCYVDCRHVWCYECHCALSLVPCIFFTRLLSVV